MIYQSYGSSISFRFLRNPLTDFHSSLISLYSHQQGFRTSLSRLLTRSFCHSNWSEMKSQSCLFCISQRAEDIEHLKILFWRPWVMAQRLREHPNYPDVLSKFPAPMSGGSELPMTPAAKSPKLTSDFCRHIRNRHITPAQTDMLIKINL